MRTTKAHRHAESLSTTDNDIHAHFARRFQQSQTEQVGCNNHQPFLLVHLRNEFSQILSIARRPGIAEQGSENFLLRDGRHWPYDNVEPKIFRSRLDHVQGLRMNIVSDKKGVALVLTGSLTKCHPFGRSSRLVQQRSVSHLHCGQVHHHLLEIQQRL